MRRLNPRSRDVRIRVLRSNPRGASIAVINPLPDARLEALSRYPGGRTGLPVSGNQDLFDAQELANLTVKNSKHYLPPGSGRPREYDCANWELLPYQQVGVAYFMEQVERANGKRALAGIFDPMGLGKTATGVGAILAMDAEAGTPSPFPALVVCPKSVCPTWVKNLACFTRGIRVVTGAKPTEILVGLRKARRTRESVVYITHYEQTLGQEGKDEQEKKVRRGALGTLRMPEFGMLILDEAHKTKNPGSYTAGAARNLAQAAHYTLLLTGTPALKTAFDVLPLLRFLEDDPYTSGAAFHDDISRWPGTVGLDRDDIAKLPAGWDVLDPAHASHLETSVRQKAVRRSRRAVYDSNTVDSTLLQPLKERHAYVLPRPDESLSPSQEVAWAAYQKDSANAVRGLDRRARGWSLDRETGRCVAPDNERGTRVQTTGISTMNPLDNALRAVEADMERTALKSPTITTPAALVQATQTAYPQDFNRAYQAARRAYLTLPQSGCDEQNVLVGVDLQARTIDLVEAYAAQFQQEHSESNIVFFTHRVTSGGGSGPAVARQLAETLSSADDRREVYVYTGQPSVNGIYVGGQQTRKGLSSRVLEEAFRVHGGCRRTAVISRSAETGVSLPAADYLVMLGRHHSPALEDQIEDRINRVGRKPPNPQIYYFVPNDIFGYGLAHRLENRRLALSAVVGEKPGDDRATSLRMPGVQTHLRRLGPHPQGLDAHRARIFRNYTFIENAEAYFLQMAAEVLQSPHVLVLKGLVGSKRLSLAVLLDHLGAKTMYKWEGWDVRRAARSAGSHPSNPSFNKGEVAVALNTTLTPIKRRQQQGLLLPNGAWVTRHHPGKGPHDAGDLLERLSRGGRERDRSNADVVTDVEELTQKQYDVLAALARSRIPNPNPNTRRGERKRRPRRRNKKRGRRWQ